MGKHRTGVAAVVAAVAGCLAAADFAPDWAREVACRESQPGMAKAAERGLVFDSSASPDATAYRWAAAEWRRAFAGDFALEVDCEVERLDHWNGFRVTAASLAPGAWQASLARHVKSPGEDLVTATCGTGGVRRTESAPCRERRLTLCLSRAGGTTTFAWRAADGTRTPVAAFDGPAADGVRFSLHLDSPAHTAARVRVAAVRLTAAREVPPAFAPAYGPVAPFGPCAFLKGEKGTRNGDGSFTLQPGGRLIFAAQAPPTACDWTLAFRSEGRIRVRAIQLGSAETIQLSDNVLWDDVDAKVPAGYAPRAANLAPWVKRFNTDLRWPLAHVTTSGLFFFEVSPAGAAAIRFGEPSLRGRALVAPPPLEGVARRAVPFTLSPDAPAAEIAVGGLAGAVEVEHFAGPQRAASSEILAGWLFVYEDGATSPAFATLRWNCGVKGEHDLEWSPAQGGPDGTWFGPPGFDWGQALYTPANALGTHWDTRYRAIFVNPFPEKRVKALQVFQMPGDARTYTVCRVTPVPPERTVFALLEPACAAFPAGQPLGVNLYEYRAAPAAPRAQLPLSLAKDGGAADALGAMAVRREGRFGGGFAEVTPRADALDYGPVTLVAGDARSSRCSLMPPRKAGDRPFYYTMICGGSDPIGDYDRMRRLGFDSAKVHMGWTLGPDGHPDFSGWDAKFDRIVRAGLEIAVRNHFDFGKVFTNAVPPLLLRRDGRDEPFPWRWGDAAHPLYREKLVDYYARCARFVAGNPHVVGINANYGQRNPIARPGKEGGVVWSAASMAALSARLGRRVDVDEVARDPATFAAYSRMNEEQGGRLIADISRAIRDAGCRAHLTFNVNFHPIENKMSGQTFGAYLRMGLEHPPASLFHETSERYCLSFVKWLAAKRTCGLPYGDECCQPPPTYEHAVLAYMWMGMMQCFESNYCQWWGGRPATENLAQLKAYHKLLYDAEYLCDPVCLALSLQTGHEEIARTARVPLHTATQCHYGLANFLRELNVNADRYMIDDCPQFDAAVKSRLLVDDVTRAMPAGFADRIEAFVRAGGTFLASADTDSLNGHAFLRRFGIEGLPARIAAAKEGTDPVPVLERPAGKGRVAVLLKGWSHGWDPGRPDGERAAMLALLTRLGGFEPLVGCSFADVFVTPYRAADGSVLVSAINITCLDRTVEITLSKALGARRPRVRDLGTGRWLEVGERDGRWAVTAAVPRINTTVLRVLAAEPAAR